MFRPSLVQVTGGVRMMPVQIALPMPQSPPMMQIAVPTPLHQSVQTPIIHKCPGKERVSGFRWYVPKGSCPEQQTICGECYDKCAGNKAKLQLWTKSLDNTNCDCYCLEMKRLEKSTTDQKHTRSVANLSSSFDGISLSSVVPQATQYVAPIEFQPSILLPQQQTVDNFTIELQHANDDKTFKPINEEKNGTYTMVSTFDVPSMTPYKVKINCKRSIRFTIDAVKVGTHSYNKNYKGEFGYNNILLSTFDGGKGFLFYSPTADEQKSNPQLKWNMDLDNVAIRIHATNMQGQTEQLTLIIRIITTEPESKKAWRNKKAQINGAKEEEIHQKLQVINARINALNESHKKYIDERSRIDQVCQAIEKDLKSKLAEASDLASQL